MIKGAAFVTIYHERPEGLYSFNIPLGTHYNVAFEAAQELFSKIKELKETEDKRIAESQQSKVSEPVTAEVVS